jgi:hypothetical protein
MKRYAIILLAILFSATTYVKAENIVIGDKLPDIRLQSWLMDMQPDQASYTCILFYHTESELCKRSLKQIKRLVKANAPHFNMIIITKEDYKSAGVALTEHLADNIGVAFDDRGRTFRYFGVKFIPFCVICNKKRIALWCGHAGGLTQQTLEKIVNTKTNKK